MRILSGLIVILLLTNCSLNKKVETVQHPLRILLITGGCCHNYPLQTQALQNATAKRIAATWTVVNEGGTGTEAEIALYNKLNWASGYDLVIHNECFANTASESYIRKITRAHYAGVPAVVIHCAMHSYRAATISDWRDFLGVTTRAHDHQDNYLVTATNKNHPILKDVPNTWTVSQDELYIIEKTGPNIEVLATSTSQVDKKQHPVIWTNSYGKARVFGTTYGHSDEMFRNEIYLKVLANGILWAAGR